MEKGLLQVDTSVFHRCHNLAIMKPLQRHRRIQGGGGALQRQAVPTEDQLPLGGDELEEGQLQRSIWKERTAQKKMGRLSCKVPRGQAENERSFFHSLERKFFKINAKIHA